MKRKKIKDVRLLVLYLGESVGNPIFEYILLKNRDLKRAVNFIQEHKKKNPEYETSEFYDVLSRHKIWHIGLDATEIYA